MAAKRAPLDHSTQDKRSENQPVEAHEPIDAESIREALSGTTPEDAAKSDHAGILQALHDRAESAFAGNEASIETSVETANEAAIDARTEATWSFRRQFAFIVLASAACWAAVLAPVLLIF